MFEILHDKVMQAQIALEKSRQLLRVLKVFDKGGVSNFERCVKDFAESVEVCEKCCSPVLCFLGDEFDEMKKKRKVYEGFVALSKACIDGKSRRFLAKPSAWVYVFNKYTETGKVLAAFQQQYAEQVKDDKVALYIVLFFLVVFGSAVILLIC